VRGCWTARGYQEISTPILVNKKLWEQSGHWEHFRENMFLVESEEQIFASKPMNWPGIDARLPSRARFVRDLPLRFADMGRLHRNERSGTLTGLFRVRQSTQDARYLTAVPTSSRTRSRSFSNWSATGTQTFAHRPFFKLSTRPPKSMGRTSSGRRPSGPCTDALKANGLAYDLNPGDGAFYGPKIGRWTSRTASGATLALATCPA